MSPPSDEPKSAARSHAGRVHDRAHVVHALLERRQPVERHGIGESGAALVEQDEAGEGGEPFAAGVPAQGSSHISSMFEIQPGT